MNTGIELIQQERLEQIQKHNFSIDYDIENNVQNEFISAIMMIISNIGFQRNNIQMPRDAFEDLKPETWSRGICQKILSKSDVEQLKILGAFAAAEIDRIQNS